MLTSNGIVGGGYVVGMDVHDVVPRGARLSEGPFDVVERLGDLVLEGFGRQGEVRLPAPLAGDLDAITDAESLPVVVAGTRDLTVSGGVEELGFGHARVS